MFTVCCWIVSRVQDRKRNEVAKSIQQVCVRECHSLILLRRRIQRDLFSYLVEGQLIGKSKISSSVSETWSTSSHQTSELCLDKEGKGRTIRLLWEKEETTALVISPPEKVELHDWTAFLDLGIPSAKDGFLFLLIEAEPAGSSCNPSSYRKFWKYGEILAWKCDSYFSVILHSSLKEVVELMFLFRLSQFLLEGGWSVYRITTIELTGKVGTLISRKGSTLQSNSGITPAHLRRLSSGIHERNEPSPLHTPIKSLSKVTSKQSVTIEENLQEEESLDEVKVAVPLLNWQERPSKRKSVGTIHLTERPTLLKRKASLSALSQKSSSLASLLFCSKSVDQEQEARYPFSSSPSPVQTPDTDKAPRSLSATATPAKRRNLLEERICSKTQDKIRRMSLSSSAVEETGRENSALRIESSVWNRPPARTGGKPPNILLLCQKEVMRQSIASLLKNILPSDRYVIYEIRWDQLGVGGWADKTALLVVSGPIPDPSTQLPILLQFIGDGGRLFAWSAEFQPFGLPPSDKKGKGILVYERMETGQLLYGAGWGTGKDMKAPPSNFPRILETVDSEGTSRPLTTSVLVKSKVENEAVILQLDGGSLGGKAILSQVLFHEMGENESSTTLLSWVLSGKLGLDCRKMKCPEYKEGFLLGDHKRIQNFLSLFPSKVEQKDLCLEFFRGNDKAAPPSHHFFPIRFFSCPKNFSTLSYFDNLETRDLGRLVIYSDVLSSVMNVLTGRSLTHGLTVIAGQQTAGKGRGKNVWLSPEGAALFGFQLHIPIQSTIGRRLSLIQHLTALAIIQAIPSHKEISLRVKWPNDLYLEGEKVGGILVESVMEEKRFTVNVGVGLNVSNSYPTTSINASVKKLGVDGKILFTTESVVARTLTELERFLDFVADGKELDKILSLYAENWVHNSDEEVSVEVSEGNYATCQIRSLDEFGFLRVSEVGSGNTFSVQPDGNSFDIANRLISMKE